jgi:hypothetical protein
VSSPDTGFPGDAPQIVELPDAYHWLRLADASWTDPLDPTYATQVGGRWNPPNSVAALYLNADLPTARSQIFRLLAGQPVEPEDLDPPYVLLSVGLPDGQRAADAVTDTGLAALGLPASYPLDDAGQPVRWERCQPIGTFAHNVGLDGVQCRSAATTDGQGRELAWFPRARQARALGPAAPFRQWWYGAL